METTAVDYGSITDLTMTVVTVPPASGSDSGHSRCGVLSFRAKGLCWVGLSNADLALPPGPNEVGPLISDAARRGLLAPVPAEVFDRGALEAAAAAFSGEDGAGALKHVPGLAAGGPAAQLAPPPPQPPEVQMNPDLMVAAGDGAIFRPFRFPNKVSEAFHLPWADINTVEDAQLRSFHECTQMHSIPKRAFGAVVYLYHHYLSQYKQKVISKGRHLLVVKISEGVGRQPKRRALAWWMPLSEVRERYADPAQADKYHCGGSVHRVCQLVETYKLHATVPIHFEIGERPHVAVGGFPFHCFSAAPDFSTRWALDSGPEALLEERREVERCLATRSPLEMSAEARKAEKRRRKRQNRKARDREKGAQEAEAADCAAEEARQVEVAERRRELVKPNAALREGGFLDGILEQMRQRRAGAAGAAGAALGPRPDAACSDSESSSSSDG